jgi:hypothetical protein
MTPPGDAEEMRGVLNDAPSIYFLNATLAGVFVVRWCDGHGIETAGRLAVWKSLLNRRWARPAKAPAPGRAIPHTSPAPSGAHKPWWSGPRP